MNAKEMAIQAAASAATARRMAAEAEAAFEAEDKAARDAARPSGYIEVVFVSDYYGSHYEYGEGDITIIAAVPDGTDTNGVKFKHGHSSSNWNEEAAKIPQSVYWDGAEWSSVP